MTSSDAGGQGQALPLRERPAALAGRQIVFAIANQKGGVGKTTTAINLGAELAARGVRTLIIDLDAQANATAALGLRGQGAHTIYDVLLDGLPLADSIIDTPQTGLSLAPSGPELAGAEVELVPALAREQRLRKAIEALAYATDESRSFGGEGGFETIIIDCAPSLGLLTVNALAAADEVLVPVQCEYLALEGLSQLTKTLEAVRRNLNPRLHLGGLLLTMYDPRTNLSQQVADEVRRHFPQTFRSVIPRSVRVSEAPSHGLPISLYAPGSAPAKAYADLAAEVIATFLPARGPAEVTS